MNADESRRWLERATGGTTPDVDRLLARVPTMLQEAQRRREAVPTLIDEILWAARAWMPRFAVASGVSAAGAGALLLADWYGVASSGLELLGGSSGLVFGAIATGIGLG